MLFDSVLVTGANILDNAVFFIINMIAARYLSVGNYGEYMTAVGCATFVIAFCDMGLNQNFIRSVSSGIHDIARAAGSVILLKSVLTFVTYGLLCAGLAVSGYNHTTIVMTLIFGGVRLCSDYLKTIFDYFDAQRRFKLSTAFKSGFSILLLAVSAAAVGFDRGIYALFTYRLFAAILMFAVVLVIILLTAKRRPEFNLRFTATFAVESLPFGISSSLSNAYQRVGVIILSLLHGTTISGMYSNAILFFISLFFLPKSVSRVLLPLLYRIDTTRKDLFQRALNVYGKIMAIGGYYIALIFFLFGNHFITMFFGDRYADTVPLLRIVSFGIPFLFTVSDSVMITLEKQRAKLRIETAALVFMVITSAVLVPFFSAEGAVISFISTYVFLFAGYHLYLRYKLGFSLKRIFSIHRTLFIICAAAIIIFKPLDAHMPFLISPIVVTLFYAIMTMIFVLDRGDLDTIRDILFKNRKTGVENELVVHAAENIMPSK